MADMQELFNKVILAVADGFASQGMAFEVQYSHLDDELKQGYCQLKKPCVAGFGISYALLTQVSSIDNAREVMAGIIKRCSALDK